MTGFLTSMCTLLLIYLTPCKATLSPPKILTVGLLDFKATAEWLPGQGNPPGTRYTLEFIHAQNMSGGKWIGSPKCTDIDILKCELNFSKPTFDLHWNYFLRVKATFKGTSSNWTTTTSSFQPYGDTRLSPPDVKISTDQKSIRINFSHWLESNPWTKPLDYVLNLFENSPTGESKLVADKILTSTSSYVFHDVPSGKNYCVNVSASHHQSPNNYNTTKCIFLLDSTRSYVLIVGIVAVLLIMFLAGIFLLFVCFNHIKPNIKKLRVPSALLNVSKPCRVLPLIPEAFQTIYQTLTWPRTYMSPGDRDLTSDDDSKIEYLEKGNFAVNSYSLTNINLPEEAETSNQYTNATNMEQSDGSGLSEMDKDNVHSDTSESCRSRSSDKLQMSIMDTHKKYKMEICFMEETLSCASSINYERVLPDEEKDNEEEMDQEDYDSASEDDYTDEYIQRANFTIDPYFIASLNPSEEAETSYPYTTTATDLEQSKGSGLSEIKLDDMHSESCSSKHSSPSEKLQMSIMDMIKKYEKDIYSPEETRSCSSSDKYERELPDEREDEEEENVLLAENVLEGGYEPRHNKKV